MKQTDFFPYFDIPSPDLSGEGTPVLGGFLLFDYFLLRCTEMCKSKIKIILIPCVILHFQVYCLLENK